MTNAIQRLADYVAEQTTRRAAPVLQSNEQYHSIFDAAGRAVATVSRPRALDRGGLFTLTDTDGALIAAYPHNPSHASICRDMHSMARAELIRLANEVDAINAGGRGRSLSAAFNPEAPRRPSRAEARTTGPRYDMAAHDLPRGRLACASGGYPLWAFDRAPIDESIDLFSDHAAPFESVRDYVEYPEARGIVAWSQGPDSRWHFTSEATPSDVATTQRHRAG